MRMYELLAVILRFYGGLYSDWRIEFGSKRLLNLLDRLDIETDEKNLDFYRYALNRSASQKIDDFDPSGYQYMEDLVSELGLSEDLEDYIWDAPHYRAYIESPIPIEREIVDQNIGHANIFYNELIYEAHRLVRHMEFEDWEFKLAAPCLQRQFLRARTDLLDRAGIPRFESVSAQRANFA